MKLEKKLEENEDRHLTWRNLIMRQIHLHSSKAAKIQLKGLEGPTYVMITSSTPGNMTASLRNTMISKSTPH